MLVLKNSSGSLSRVRPPLFSGSPNWQLGPTARRTARRGVLVPSAGLSCRPLATASRHSSEVSEVFAMTKMQEKSRELATLRCNFSPCVTSTATFPVSRGWTGDPRSNGSYDLCSGQHGP
eukprot:2762967-Prymnesium_polylepis.2